VLSERVVQLLHQQQLRPGAAEIEALGALEEPDVARPPWEEIEAWS
jgi:hypothetical protein